MKTSGLIESMFHLMRFVIVENYLILLNQRFIGIILIVKSFMQSMFQKAQVGSQGSPISQLGQTVERRRGEECLGQRVGTSMYKHTWLSAEVCWVRSGGLEACESVQSIATSSFIPITYVHHYDWMLLYQQFVNPIT